MEAEVNGSVSQKRERVLLLGITGGRQQHSVSLRDRSIWLKVSNGE